MIAAEALAVNGDLLDKHLAALDPVVGHADAARAHAFRAPTTSRCCASGRRCAGA